MGIEKKIPTDVSPEAASLLERAYSLERDEQSRALYRDWAETYDETKLDGLAYESPARVASLLAQHLMDRDAAVLDVGCGTGLLGRELAEHGYLCIDGLDFMPEMMLIAQRVGDYRAFITADLNEPLGIPSASYAGACCCGTFTHGHVGAECQDELFQILKPGAPFAFHGQARSLRVPRVQGQACGADGGRQNNRARLHARPAQRHTSEQPDGVFCVLHALDQVLGFRHVREADAGRR
jgi:SAM-dependent methyltransferase